MKQAIQILQVAIQIFNSPAFNAEHPNGSGYLCLIPYQSSFDQPVHALVSFGDIPHDKRKGRASRAQEKLLRLLNGDRNHVSSWQTRNPELSQYGGAIRVGDWILSFAGLPEALDEVFMLLVADFSKLAEREPILQITVYSQTAELFHRLRTAMTGIIIER